MANKIMSNFQVILVFVNLSKGIAFESMLDLSDSGLCRLMYLDFACSPASIWKFIDTHTGLKI